MVNRKVLEEESSSVRRLPCPGMSEPESFLPASRLITDSKRSPERDPTNIIKPNATALNSHTEKEYIILYQN